VHGERIRFLITGSARLDLYRKGGDSLQGRYHAHRLHGFSVGEVQHSTVELTPGEAISFPEVSQPDLMASLSSLNREVKLNRTESGVITPG
jgi:predicted AAA+ superfamily ATPase